MKKIFSFLMPMVISLIMPITISANTWNGTTDTEWRSAGTNAYYIDSAEELAGLASKVNSGTTYSGYTFFLTTNLDLNGTSHNWNPIGYFNGVPGGAIKNSENYFSGTFNGQGYTISNYSASYNAGSGTGKITVGLFGAIRGASIKNLTVSNSYVYVKSNAYRVYGGAIVGWMDSNSVIDNCGSYNNNINVVARFGLSGQANAGGICGSAENSTAQNCSVFGNSITADGTSKDNSAAVSNNYGGSTLTSNTEYTSASQMTAGVAQKAQAQNEQIHMWNNWGVGTEPTTAKDGTHYYMLDESTGTPTNKIYLAVNLKAADAASVSKEANVSVNSDDKIAFTYEGSTYDLYLKGSTVTAEFYPLGYSGNWNDHGNYVNFGENPTIVNNLDVFENNRYERVQTVSQALTTPIVTPYGITYNIPSTAEDMTQKVVAINRSTIIYNNFGADAEGAVEPKTPFFIDESTWRPTTKKYFVYTGITNVDNVTSDVTTASETLFYDGIEYPLFYEGQNIDVNIKYNLPGYKGDWTDHGCYVAQILMNGNACEIANTTITNNISEEGYNGERYARSQEVSFSISMPSTPVSFSYTTATTHEQAENVAEAVKAINRSTIIYNNFGADAEGAVVPKTPYFIDESTFRPTEFVYYTLSGVTDLENITSNVTISTEGFNYNGFDTPLYYAGQELDLTVKYNLPGYKGDWTDHGCYVAQTLINNSECEVANTTITNNISEEGYNGERYARSQEVTLKATMPEAPLAISYTSADSHEQAENVAEAVKVINRSTIIYNNFGADAEGAVEPKTPYFIDESTFRPTEFVYYTYSGVTDLENITSDVTISTEGFNYNGFDTPLYYAGQELDLTVKYNLPGYKGDWTDHGCYVAQTLINNSECEVVNTTITNNISEEGYNGERYARLQEVTLKATMPEAPLAISYTSADSHEQAENVAEAVKAINNATIEYNNWGVGEEPKTPYFIDESTFLPTEYIYYLVTFYDDKENMREIPTIKESNLSKVYNYNNVDYTLFPTGSNIEIESYPLGYSTDWSSKGYYLNVVAVFTSEPIYLTLEANSIYDDLKNATENNYFRTQVTTVKLPATGINGPILLACGVGEVPENAEFNDIAEDVKNINNATIIYNNWGVGEEPKTPYFIDEETYTSTDKIYYAFEPSIVNPEGDRGTTGVREDAEYIHSESMKTFSHNDIEYPLYANGDVFGIKCYLDGFTTEMIEDNSGWYVKQVQDSDNNSWEILTDSEYTEVIYDNTIDGFDNDVERFNREHTVYVSVPLVTEMRNHPICLAYTTEGKINNDTTVKLDSITKYSNASYANGVISYDGVIEVYNINGLLVARGENQVNIKALNSGIYFVRCGNETIKIAR